MSLRRAAPTWRPSWRFPSARPSRAARPRFRCAAHDGKVETLTVKIPAGIDEGKKIRLRGQGEEVPGGTPGDILITIHVAPHPWFTRRGNNLEVRVPLTLAEAALGAKVDVPTPKGTIALRIPPGTSSGKKLRVKGHGVAAREGEPGDLYAEIEIVLPSPLDDECVELIKKLDEHAQQRTPSRPAARLAMVAQLLAKVVVTLPGADVLWAAGDKAEPLLMRLDPARRTKVVMALLALLLLGAALVALVIIGGRSVLRIVRKSHGPTPTLEERWYRKPLVPGEPHSSSTHDPE